MRDIFVVVMEQGQYSDYRMEVLCWFDNLEEANAEVSRLDKEATKVGDLYYDPRYSTINLPHGTTLAGKKLE